MATATVTVATDSELSAVVSTRSRSGFDSSGSIDLLAALQLHNTSRQGVTQVPGLVRLKPAYHLHGKACFLQQVHFIFKKSAFIFYL